mmetsp:Transcript_28568/g.43203  ORF Transcript_28568/g.43203 Transcript_28568/m.43203 type:complete len:207 (+) Transcript_28568:64-684(+)
MLWRQMPRQPRSWIRTSSPQSPSRQQRYSNSNNKNRISSSSSSSNSSSPRRMAGCPKAKLLKEVQLLRQRPASRRVPKTVSSWKRPSPRRWRGVASCSKKAQAPVPARCDQHRSAGVHCSSRRRRHSLRRAKTNRWTWKLRLPLRCCGIQPWGLSCPPHAPCRRCRCSLLPRRRKIGPMRRTSKQPWKGSWAREDGTCTLASRFEA